MENPNTKILKELEINSEMGLVQGEKMIAAVDGLEPVMEGILMKTNELVEETKKNAETKKSIEIEINGAETTFYKGEKGDPGPKGEFTDEDVARVTELVRAQVSDGKDGRDGKDGKDGATPVRGVDYFTDEDIANFIQEVVPFFPKGEQGPTGENGADAEVDYSFVVQEVLKKIPKAKEFKTDTAEELKQKLESLEVGLDYDTLSNTPNIEQIVRSVSSKTVSLQELDNVDLSGVTITNGKYVLGSGGSGGAVDSVFGRTGVVTAQSGDYTTAIVADSSNKRYVTDAQLTVLGNTSGTNTGDQTSIVGITGTLAEFNTALTGADFATLAGSETFTNKTLTSPVINSATIGTSLVPTTNDGAALGSTANSFSDLFIASGGVINWNNGNATITHSAGLLTSNVPIQMPYIGVGGTPNSSTGLLVSGTGYTSNLIAATGSLSPTANTNATLYRIAGTIVEASSGTHNLMSAMFLGTTTVTGGSATVNNTAGLYIEGAMTATVVGENYAIWSDDGINRFDGEVRIGGALDHNGTTVGFYGVTPVVRSSAYTVTNATTDRSYDANATTVDELADVLATLLADLKLTGIIA
jgi:hypothetical protein